MHSINGVRAEGRGNGAKVQLSGIPKGHFSPVIQ